MELLGLLEMGQAHVSLGSTVLAVTALSPELILEAAKHRHTVCTARGGRWDSSLQAQQQHDMVAPIMLMQVYACCL